MAELEILEALVSFFCPTSDAASTCREFISNHSQVLPPIGPLFYFLLFPAVFTILFIMILMDSVKVAKGHRGMQILLGVTAFIFIIISGWYPIMLVLSEFWYIAIILLGFLWFLKGHFGKKEGGGPSGKMPGLAMGGAMSAIAEDLKKRAYLKASGQEKRMKNLIKVEFDALKATANRIEGKDPEAWRGWPAARASAMEAVKEYRDAVSIGGFQVSNDLDRMVEEMDKIVKKLDKNAPPEFRTGR